MFDYTLQPYVTLYQTPTLVCVPTLTRASITSFTPLDNSEVGVHVCTYTHERLSTPPTTNPPHSYTLTITVLNFNSPPIFTSQLDTKIELSLKALKNGEFTLEMPGVVDLVDAGDSIVCSIGGEVSGCIVAEYDGWWKLNVLSTCTKGTYPVVFSCSDDNTVNDPVNNI